MPEVPMIATGDFKYRTRRLMAGDEFTARNDMDARILERVRKVAAPHEAKTAKAENPAPVIPTVEEVLTAEVVEDAPKAAPKPKPKRKAPKPGERARKAKAKK